MYKIINVLTVAISVVLTHITLTSAATKAAEEVISYAVGDIYNQYFATVLTNPRHYSMQYNSKHVFFGIKVKSVEECVYKLKMLL